MRGVSCPLAIREADAYVPMDCVGASEFAIERVRLSIITALTLERITGMNTCFRVVDQLHDWLRYLHSDFSRAQVFPLLPGFEACCE